MKIVDVLQKTRDDDNDITWIFVIDEVPQKYIDMTYKMDECNYFNGHGLEIECITTNGKVNQDYDVNLQYYFDDYEVVAVLNSDKEAIKCIEDFVNKIGNNLPFSEDKGQLEYSEMIQDMLMEEENE